MARPIISWVDGTTLSPISKLQFSSETGSFSAIVADTESVVAHLGLVNNFTVGVPAEEAVMDATDCQLKVTATDGTTNAPVVQERWIHAKCVTGGDGSYTRLGLLSESEVKLNVTAGDVSRPNTISGGANDGTIEGTGQYNVAKVDLMAKPDLNTTATGGLQQFRLVLIYSYGAQ